MSLDGHMYAFCAGGAGLVAILGLLKALPGAFLVPLVTSGSDRVRRERLLIAMSCRGHCCSAWPPPR